MTSLVFPSIAFERESLSTATLHVFCVYRSGGLTPIDSVQGRLEIFPQPVEIALIGPKSLDAFLRG
jgi:hypothetical protein